MKRHLIYSPPVIVENVLLFIPGRPVQIPRDYGTAGRGRRQNIVYAQNIQSINCNGKN